MSLIPDPICDFCSGTPVRWCYKISPGGIIGTVIVGSHSETHGDQDGLWGACDECKSLIESRDREGLLNRSVKQFQKLYADTLVSDSAIREMASHPHGLFWNRYDGSDPEPMNETAERWLIDPPNTNLT
jgi:hypothetical protein